MSELSHYDETGRAKMVDVSDKALTARVAVASCRVLLSPATLEKLRSHENPKGDPLEIARIAGIMAAKKTSELIPLCHPIRLSKIWRSYANCGSPSVAAFDSSTGVSQRNTSSLSPPMLSKNWR